MIVVQLAMRHPPLHKTKPLKEPWFEVWIIRIPCKRILPQQEKGATPMHVN